MLTALILAPLAGLLAALIAPRRAVPALACLASLAPLGIAVALIARFDRGAGLQEVVDEAWIAQLGVRYRLGVDGLNLFMVALTAFAWPVATFAAARQKTLLGDPDAAREERPRMFFAMLALAQAATLGAFVAQDLILFVLFFDLVLAPFYLLIGVWGGADRVAATTRFMIYTLAGSLLMLAAAVAYGTLAAARYQLATPTFDLAKLAQMPLDPAAQRWIFVAIALALLIKTPAFPLHGWMPAAYRAAPLPVLLVLSAVVAKLGAYGFMRVALPLLPQGVDTFQHVILVAAVISILYGSVMAMTQDNVRLIVGYSSIAQLGFITLGIFSIDAKGAEGALIQMVAHGLVATALFVIIGMLAERCGSESLARMGGVAVRAPILASLFLVVALATLAMPGSLNFVGELYVLFGAFDTQLVYGLVAAAGVALAAAYMIRFLQGAMHGPAGAAGAAAATAGAGETSTTGPPAAARGDLGWAEAALLAPAVIVLVALSVYPQHLVERVAPAAAAVARSGAGADKITSPRGPGDRDEGEAPGMNRGMGGDGKPGGPRQAGPDHGEARGPGQPGPGDEAGQGRTNGVSPTPSPGSKVHSIEEGR